MAKEWTVTLNTGAKMPAFGLGTWQSQPGQVGAAVEAALKAGYRHIDCAHVYSNEDEVGAALQKCFDEGVCKREDVFVTSKLWNADHAREDVVPACQVVLKNLKLDYLDLFLIHSPLSLKKGVPLTAMTDDNKLGYDEERMSQTWQGMEELVAKGLTKAIGISNFTITKTERLLRTAKIVPAVNQIECHPYFQQQKLKDYCDSKGIVFEAYAPLGSPARPSMTKQGTDPVVLEDPVINDIAKKYTSSPAQVCIAFALHRGMVVIPKSVTPSRIVDNIKSTTLTLSEEDMECLRGVDKNCRLFKGEFFLPSGMTWEEAWDVDADDKFVVKA